MTHGRERYIFVRNSELENAALASCKLHSDCEAVAERALDSIVYFCTSIRETWEMLNKTEDLLNF